MATEVDEGSVDHPPLSNVLKEDLPELTSDRAFLSGGREMGALIRAKDWSKTSLGPIESWPHSLRTTVSICLASDLPICIIWGPNLVQIYNDGYRVICGEKHPRSMGQNFAECWREAWPVIGDAHDSALAGDTAFLENQHIFLERHGYVEECFFTFSFSPIRDESGCVVGLFHPVIEMTAKMLGERRTRALRDVAARTANTKTVQEACTRAAQSLAGQEWDVPFSLMYVFDGDEASARLIASSGIPDSDERNAMSSGVPQSWPLTEVPAKRHGEVVGNFGAWFGDLRCGPYPESPREAVALPLVLPGAERPVGVLIAGVSGRLTLNQAYRDFYELLGAAVTTAVASGRAFEEERKRAEALAEIDRAKTAFFSNVSHEFRTPLTLMLGPVEELLAKSHTELALSAKGQLEVVNRNGLRLLKLVNTLLDFSRIEAGRAQASFEATDLSAFTAELASCFRSATERAGLHLVVDCPTLSETVYVDRDMWEKVVLNLLSNAFKFTFEGGITAALHQRNGVAELIVSDTGVGIPAEAMPRLFERFYRVENMRSRTHEGSGIGLALVQELVKLHGGSVRAESKIGKGTTFIVTVPLGKAHLPAAQLRSRHNQISTAMGAAPFVEEALRWLPSEDRTEGSGLRTEMTETALPLLSPQHSDLSTEVTRPRVLVVDDNADMRQYIVRLLAERYRVEAAADGEAALAAIRVSAPNLILSDVMMPKLDGFGLLRALRTDPDTKTIPVILLSARAGEESRIEGLEQGADDYLIKPFSARELLARVETQVKMARMRREAEQRVMSILESLTDGFHVVDAAGRFAYFNSAARSMFAEQGIQADILIGQHAFEAFPAVRELPSGIALQRTLSERVPTEAENFYTPWGRWFAVRHYPTVDGGVSTFFQDITERKRAYEALRASEQETKRARDYAEATLRTSPVPLLILEKDLRVNTANEAFYHTFQVNPAETQGRLVYELGNGQWNIPKLRELLETILPQQTVFRGFEVTHDFESIGRRTVLLNARRMESEPDIPESIVLVIEDITERKEAEEALHKSKERFDIVSDAAEVGFWFCDLPFDELVWDNRVKEHFWLPQDAKVTIHTFYERLHPDDRERTRKSIEESIANKTRYEIEYRTVSSQGEEKWIRAIGRTFYEYEKPIRFDGMTLDITERKRTEKRLTQFTAELEQRVAERTYELAQSEDRLRTLATELNLAEQRERKRLAAELHDHLQQMLVLGRLTIGQCKRVAAAVPAVEQILKKVDDIFSDSLIYTRTLVSDLSPTVLRDHGLATALQWLGPYMQKHNQKVTVTVPDDEGLKLPEDQVILLFQSTRELLINSAKHAGTGKATLKMEQGGENLYITVSDTGAGFDLAAAAAGAPNGGISSKFGLFSIRERMRALGGSFQIESTPGKGTTATLALPLGGGAAARTEDPGLRTDNVTLKTPDGHHLAPVRQHDVPYSSHRGPQSSALKNAPIRILLVDDHTVMRQGLRSIVTAYDHLEVVGEAGDGMEAVELAQQLNPDVVVMDINMPKMDGIEATQRIKTDQPTTVVIGLSVNQSADTEKKMKEAGAFTYLTKESAVDALCHAIEQAVSYKQPTAAHPSS